MAIHQKIPPCETNDEAEASTNNSSYSSSSSSDEESLACSENEGNHEKAKMVIQRLRRSRAFKPTPASLRACPTFGQNSLIKARSRVNRNVRYALMMKRLHNHLASLRSLLPPTARSRQSCSVIADALRYRMALRREIQQLQTALPFAHQVDVRRVESGGFQIGIACKKKSGLLVALMEAMESFGLLFANVSISCQNDNITIDSLSTQEIGERIGSLKGVLIATISRFNRTQQELEKQQQ